MTNLYEETIGKLKLFDKTIEDVQLVGTMAYTIPTDLFWELAKDTNYDNGFGAPEVAVDLIIVGDDWYMYRNEYDGSEWWRFSTLPQKPNEEREVSRLMINETQVGWRDLGECNEVEEE